MIIGDLLALAVPLLSQVSAAGQFSGRLSGVMMIVMLLGVVSTNVINSYGGMLCVEIIAGSFKALKPSQPRRTTLILIVGVAGAALAVIGQGNFLNNLTNFIPFKYQCIRC